MCGKSKKGICKNVKQCHSPHTLGFVKDGYFSQFYITFLYYVLMLIQNELMKRYTQILKEEVGLSSQGDLSLNPSSLSSYLRASSKFYHLSEPPVSSYEKWSNTLVRPRKSIREAPSALLEP